MENNSRSADVRSSGYLRNPEQVPFCPATNTATASAVWNGLRTAETSSFLLGTGTQARTARCKEILTLL